MRPMSVALDVSKLSGWLNADAFCRVERRIEMWMGYERGVQRGKGQPGIGRMTRAEPAHQKHAVHVCDAGRVETQRLVER